MGRSAMLRGACFLAGLAASGPALAGGGYRVKPPDFAGERPGSVQRLVRPFGDWTLVCDENLLSRKRVCNVSQSFVDRDGRTAFSWSLAATETGAPVLLLRAPNEGSSDTRRARLRLSEGGKPTEVALPSCDASLCLGLLPVGPDLRREIGAGGVAEVALVAGGQPATFRTELKNLVAALAALK